MTGWVFRSGSASKVAGIFYEIGITSKRGSIDRVSSRLFFMCGFSCVSADVDYF